MYRWAGVDLYRTIQKMDIKELNRFKKDSKVDSGVRAGRETWDLQGTFELGAKFAMDKKIWIIVHARSRLYGVQASSEQAATRIAQKYLPTVGRFRIVRVR